jgi:tetratricopeptide (TPR) repeat protein
LSKIVKTSRGRNWRRILLLAIVAGLVVGGAGLIALRLRSGGRARLQKAQLYLKAGNYAKAVEEYRLAIEKAPDALEARTGLVRALVARRAFDEAEKELDEAIRRGLPSERGVVLKAALLGQRADHRLTAEGSEVTAELVRSVLSEDVDPAVQILREAARGSAKPSDDLWSMLGEMLVRKGRMLVAEWRLLHRDLSLAIDLSKQDEAVELRTRIAEKQRDITSCRAEATAAYRKAIEIDPEAAGPRVAVAQQAVAEYVPRLREARDVLAPLMTRSPVPEGALQVMTLVERYSDQPERALGHVNALLEQSPSRYDYAVMKSEILLEMERYDEAAPVVAGLAKLRPEDATTHYEQGRLLLAQGRVADAVNHLQAVFAQGQRHWPKARLLLAQALLKQGNFEQGVLNLRRVMDDAKISVVTSARDRKELQEIRYDACLGLAARSDALGAVEAREFAARAFQLFPERDESFQLLMELARKAELSPEGVEAAVLVHAAALSRGPDGSETALRICDEWLPTLGSAPNKAGRLRAFRARLLASRGDYREAVAAYESLWNDFPKSRDLGYEIARLHDRLGRKEQVRATFERLFESAPNDSRALAGLVWSHVQTGDMEGAKALLARLEKEIGPEKVRQVMTGLYAREGKLEEALALAREQSAADPENAPAHVLLAELLWRTGDRDAASKEFDAALRIAPDYVPAYLRALLDIESGRPADAVTLLRGAAERFRGDALVLASLAVALQADGKAAEGLSVLTDACRADAGPAPALDGPRRVLAFILAGEGRLEEAQRWNAMLVGVNWGFIEDRADLVRKIAELGPPEGPAAALNANLIGLYSNGGLNNSALEETRKLQARTPDEPLVACWAADLTDHLDRHEEALAAYREVIAAHPQFLRARLMLAQSLVDRGDPASAERVFEEAIEVAGPDYAAGIHLRLAGLMEQLEQYDQAASHYEIAAEDPKTAPAACNNLAWLLAVRRGDPEAGLPYARRAAELAPADAAVLDTLGWVLYLSGRYEEALGPLTTARQGLPAMPSVRYHLGMALLKLNRKEQAKAELQEALTLSPDFPEANEARAALSGS